MWPLNQRLLRNFGLIIEKFIHACSNKLLFMMLNSTGLAWYNWRQKHHLNEHTRISFLNGNNAVTILLISTVHPSQLFCLAHASVYTDGVNTMDVRL